MKIETIRLKNYKVYNDLELTNLPNMVIFVGANGTGKSTIFEVFEFLSLALSGNVRSALANKGGFKEVISRGQTGCIEIELQFRLKIYLGILGKEYGFVGEKGVSVTEEEFDEASRLHKQRFVFVTNHANAERDKKQISFIQKAQAFLVRRKFSDYAD